MLDFPNTCIRIVWENHTNMNYHKRGFHADMYVRGKHVHCDDHTEFLPIDTNSRERSYFLESLYVIKRLRKKAAEKYGVLSLPVVVLHTLNHIPMEVM